MNTQKIIRDVDEIHIIDLNKKLLFTSLKAPQTYIPPVDKALNLVLDDDRPLKIINAPENISASIMRLQNYENRFLFKKQIRDENIRNFIKILNSNIQNGKERSIFSGKIGVLNKKIYINLT